MNTVSVDQPKRKSELQELLNGYNRILVRAEIIDVIKEARNIPIKEARDVKTLFPSEVKKVLERFQ